MNYQLVEFRADFEATVAVINEAGAWLARTGKDPRHQWRPENLLAAQLAAFADPGDFYAGFVAGVAAVGAVLVNTPILPDWSVVDGNQRAVPALYVHWLAVRRAFAGRGLPAALMAFADQLARSQAKGRIRLDVDADGPKLGRLYEAMGFELVTVVDDGLNRTALYERRLT